MRRTYCDTRDVLDKLSRNVFGRLNRSVAVLPRQPEGRKR